ESAISFGNTLSKGYYKLVATSGVSVTLSYTNSFTDVSYNYYNQLGQLIASIAPEGVKQLYTNTYASKTAIPFVNLYQYNVQGKLVSKTTADGGTTQFVYRQDGKIRFSQNSVQAPVGKFSYVNYDQLGRPIEGGEYLPDANGIVFGSTLMTSVLENVTPTGGLTTGTKYDVEAILYDIPDASYGLTSYVQDPIYVGGAVSAVRKYSSIVNNLPVATNIVSASWYNYDEEGKVVWKIKFIQGLGYKTTDYTYDVLGRLIKKVYQASTAAETFIHYFQFDPANGNLWKIYTNTVDHPVVYIGGSFSRNPNPDPTTDMLQATYIYYLHGGLKRIELATNLQGIDYTYTLQGALKAINNNNKNADPGGDNTNSNGFGPDAFGTVLDYFPGDYVNNRTNGVQPITGVNTSSIIPPANESYVGNIKAMSWYSEKPASVTNVTDAPVAYIYQYDPKYQFTSSTWGTIPDFTVSPANFTATNFNQEVVKDPVAGTPAYDANGNILNLQRTDGNGNLTDKFAYNYVANTNQLGSVVNTATGTAQTYASYTYDAIGRMTSETITNPLTNVGTTEYVQYDITNKVRAVTTDPAFNNPIVSYLYDEAGTRIIKNTYNSSNQLIEVTYYAGDATYTQSITGGVYGAITAEEYQIQGGKNRLGIYYRPNNIYAYQLTDHLGNVRAVIAQSGSTYQVRMYTDYYPYGMIIQQGGGNDYRYDYQGDNSEKDNETGWNSFTLRMYNSRIARWMTTDPGEQFFSPYEAMGNTPQNGTDPTGAECGSCGGGYDDINNPVNGESFSQSSDGGLQVSSVSPSNDNSMMPNVIVVAGIDDIAPPSNHDYFDASVGIIGGATEFAVAGGLDWLSGGLATPLTMGLMIDGATRVGLNGTKLLTYASGNKLAGNAIPVNIGGVVGKGADLLSGQSIYSYGKGQMIGAATNDVISFITTGGSGPELLDNLADPSVVNSAMYANALGGYIYGLYGDVAPLNTNTKH
ncbi:MAG TPA: RHS repeat-associated core domain-containing protein, partial [Ferruginibacter sp.]|nr:RHS repeat-associated core domain-containing protein [Ferruginibacter sp.]